MASSHSNTGNVVDIARFSPPRLHPVEIELIDFFVHLAATFGLPKSIGELFGLLYCSAEPLPFEEIVSRLGISKGSASQGLRALQSFNAVQTVYRPRDRRTFYRAEDSMRRLVTGLLDTKVSPHLQATGERLNAISTHLRDSDVPPPLAPKKLLKKRVGALQNWCRLAESAIPLVAEMSAPEDGRKRP